MGEEVYINPKNMDSIIFKFEMPESATVFNYLREKFGPTFFNNLNNVSMNYRFWDDLLKGVNAYIRRGYKGSRNMKNYNQRFRVLFPDYDGILSPEALAGWKGLDQQFEKGKIFLLDQEVKQKKAIDEIVDVLGTKLWTEFQEAVTLVKPKAN